SQPRQIFLESLLNGTSPIIPIQSTPSQSSLPFLLTSPMVQGANGSISSPGVPRIIPSNSGRVQVGTTLLVLPANGSAFNFVNKT
ncbi:hypothetical protein PMAYCL1PPCAC_07295, partial [Pristionchus mayeri]